MTEELLAWNVGTFGTRAICERPFACYKTQRTLPRNTIMRYAVVGFGHHGEKVAQAFASAQTAELTGICTGSAGKLSTLRARYPETKISSSYEDFLRDPDIDVIYLCLPNHLHVPRALEALESGKHVLCEKPCALTESDARSLLTRATAAGKIVREAFMYRFHPQHALVRELLAEGSIGSPRLFVGHFHYSLNDPTNIRLRSECGGGGLNDVGCYLFDVLELLFREPVARLSGSWRIHPDFGVDTVASLQATLESGLVAHLTSGCELPRANWYAIHGTAGSLRVRSAFRAEPNQKAVIELERTDGKTELITVAPAHQLALQLDAFSREAWGDSAPPLVWSDVLRNARLLEKGAEACRTGKTLVL